MKKAWIYAFIALFLWGIHGPAGRYLAINDVDMYFVFSFRLWIGTFVFFIFLLINKCLKINWKEDLKQILLISGIGLIANTIVFHLTLNYLPGTFVMILENLSPIFVLLATLLFYGIKPKLSEIIALILSFLGIFLIILGKDSFPELSEGYYLGVFLGVLTGITFGAYIFFSADLLKKFKNDYVSVIKFQFKIMLIAAIACSPFLITAKSFPSNPTQWFWVFEMGIFQSGLAYLFWSFALVYINANTASILFLLTILFTTINEYLFLDLRLNTFLVLGALLICFGGYYITNSMRK
ncbi:MAG: DMT family transporter [Candidatus Cloacimonetes bacterium]|nr:DMT family transporter [Candidatus Cloacimonadota bacterium]